MYIHQVPSVYDVSDEGTQVNWFILPKKSDVRWQTQTTTPGTNEGAETPLRPQHAKDSRFSPQQSAGVAERLKVPQLRTKNCFTCSPQCCKLVLLGSLLITLVLALANLLNRIVAICQKK